MKINKLVLLAFISTLFFASCDSEEPMQPTPYFPLGEYDSGVLVLNQGGFNANNAEISYISFGLNTLENNIFSTINPSLTLGDTGQDIGFYQDLAYVVLNNTPKIQIINRYTLKNIGTIETGLSNPRYIAFANGKGYVTNWGDGSNANDDYVAVINLDSNTVTSTIPVVEGPERIIESLGKLYVAHTGGFGYGNTISVINSNSNTVTSTITVGFVPNAMAINNSVLLVSCGGKPSFSGSESAGGIVKINTLTNTVSNTYAYASETTHPSNLVVSGSNIYFTIDSGIYTMSLSSSTLPLVPAFTTNMQGVYGIYSFAVKNNHIYVGDAGDYVSNGKVYIYSQGLFGETLGKLEKTHTVGIIPAGFYFNQ